MCHTIDKDLRGKERGKERGPNQEQEENDHLMK
jgi:hypothetical protein